MEQSKIKKVLAILLAIIFVVSLTAVAASARGVPDLLPLASAGHGFGHTMSGTTGGGISDHSMVAGAVYGAGRSIIGLDHGIKIG